MEKLLVILLYLNMLPVADAPLTNQVMLDYARKIEPYYVNLGIPTDTSNTSLRSLPSTYWGATVWNDRCTSQVYLSEQFTQAWNPFYKSPMWKYVLAHEWAHVAQGKLCMNNESEAELIALVVMADAGEWEAVITTLEWMLTLSVGDEVLDRLHLSPQEEAYYRAVDLPLPEVLKLLFNDDDGIFELKTGSLDARNLWDFVMSLPRMPEGFNTFGILHY